ncbi:hypothetical protein L1887_11026 [Cichorium endivia]|nr:hypothetical protein L1887_11026 [Cichorium endivia]
MPDGMVVLKDANDHGFGVKTPITKKERRYLYFKGHDGRLWCGTRGRETYISNAGNKPLMEPIFNPSSKAHAGQNSGRPFPSKFTE